MIDDELSDLPPSALRDYADDARLERVWQRLGPNVAPAPARARSGLLLAPAFGLAVFVLGVLVGRTWLPATPALPEVVAEAPQPSEPSEPSVAPAGERRDRPRAAPPEPRPRSTPSRAVAPEALAPDEQAPEFEMPSVYGSPYTPEPAPGPAEWQRLADAGDFPAAWVALDHVGGFDGAVSSASAEQLLLLVDVARASGGREHAIRALRRLTNAFPSAPEAPLAAWTLGNMLEQSGDAAGAAEAYELYRRLSPAGDFAEDAAARQVDVALARQDLELATRLVDQYEKDFPNGRRLAEFREELGKLASERADGGAPAPAPSPEPPAAPHDLRPY